IAECLSHGTTLIGDISAGGASWDMLTQASIRAVVFRELLGLPIDRAETALADLNVWLQSHPPRPTCRAALRPHAPHSARSSLFTAASTSGVPTAIHLAETPIENELLVSRRGPFVPFLRDLGVWDPTGLADNFDHVLSLFNGKAPALFVHANYLP